MTQARAAERLGVSQPYYAMLESGRRPLTPELLAAAVRKLGLSPTELPMSFGTKPLDPERFAQELAALGYPGFAHMKRGRVRNPWALLVEGLSQEKLEARLVEALPWLLVRFDLQEDRDRLVREARAATVQNRLGFVADLALEVLRDSEGQEVREREAGVRALLETLRERPLANEDTFMQGELSERQREWLREVRPQAATKWNLLTDWKAADLPMQPDQRRIPEPWLSLLKEVDAALSEPYIEMVCLGGFVLTALYEIPRTTADLDFIELRPPVATGELMELARKDSKLAKKYRVHLQNVSAIAEMPEDFETRLTEIGNLVRLRLLAPDAIDLVLSKLARNNPKDREDVKYVAEKAGLRFGDVKARFDSEMKPWIPNPQFHERTLEIVWRDLFRS